VGYRRNLARHWSMTAFLTADNLLDQAYSLGYDLNAVGGRYYNAAPRRSWSAGLLIRAWAD
jgi:iron complex outermembrane recepter protein